MTHLWIAVLFSLNMVCCEVPTTLRLVNIVFRHGDRSPVFSFDSDPNQADTWPQGLGGQLTKQGMQRAFSLGKFLRERYNGYLDERYIREQVYVRSTDYDRTLMTAQIVLNGLYPPAGEQIWKNDTPWQPIPVFSESAGCDHLFGHASCPRQMEIINDVFKNLTKREFIIQKHQSLYAVIKENVGNITDIKEDLRNFMYDVQHIRDAVYCEKMDNRKIASWITDDVIQQMDSLIEDEMSEFYHVRATWRLRGALTAQFIRDMNLRQAELLKTQMKAFIYSGHDSTLMDLMLSLGMYTNQSVTFTTCIMVELHKIGPGNSSMDYIVQMHHREGLTGKLTTLTIPGCQADCPLDKFINLTEATVPEDWYRECQLFQIGYDLSDQAMKLVLASVGTILLLVITVAGIGCCCHNLFLPKMPKHYHKHDAFNSDPEEIPMIGNDSDSEDIIHEVAS